MNQHKCPLCRSFFPDNAARTTHVMTGHGPAGVAWLLARNDRARLGRQHHWKRFALIVTAIGIVQAQVMGARLLPGFWATCLLTAVFLLALGVLVAAGFHAGAARALTTAEPSRPDGWLPWLN